MIVHNELLEYLLDKYNPTISDIMIGDNNGDHALLWGHFMIGRLTTLINYIIKIKAKNTDIMIPVRENMNILHKLCFNNKIRDLELLFKSINFSDDDYKSCDKYGWNMLTYACSSNNIKFITYIINVLLQRKNVITKSFLMVPIHDNTVFDYIDNDTRDKLYCKLLENDINDMISEIISCY